MQEFITFYGCQGDIGKVRTAVVAGVGVPLAMFLAWDAVILGSLGGGGGSASGRADPLAALAAGSPAVGTLIQVLRDVHVPTGSGHFQAHECHLQ